MSQPEICFGVGTVVPCATDSAVPIWDSPTELRVVALVADGLTNPQIGERMFISRGTVKVHVSPIFAKLGTSTRAELAAQATRRATKQPDFT